MGDMADFILEQGEYEDDGEMFDHESEWMMRDGTVLQIAQMDDRHLNNTIRMLAAKNPDGHPSLDHPMRDELKRRATCS